MSAHRADPLDRLARGTKTAELSPAIFLEAARIIAEGEQWFACIALDRASNAEGIPCDHNGDSPACRWFEAVLRPQWAVDDEVNVWYGDDAPENTMARTLGLLLCGELVREGFVPERATD